MEESITKKFSLKFIVIVLFALTLISGFLLGYLFIDYYKNAVVKDKSSIAKNQQVIDELGLLIGKNKELITQYDVLTKEINQLKSSYTANQTIKDSIKDYELIVGDRKAKGPGIIMEIDINIAQYWFIDLINELFNLEAETIEINKIRLTPETYILQNNETNQIYINNTPIETPYVFKAIGNPNTLYQGLTGTTGLIEKMKHTFINKSNMVKISIANDIEI